MSNLSAQTRQYQMLQDQVSTGQRFQTIGENPVAAIQTIVLQQTLERKQQLASNVEMNRSLLAASEDALGNVSNVFNQMKTFILAGLGDATSAAEKQQMAAEVETLIQEVTNLGNTKFRGRYLFGGSENTTAPFSNASNNNAIRFNGNTHSIDAYVTLDNLLMNNVSASETFKPLADVQGSDLNPAVTGQTRIDSLFAGQGLALGVISVTVDVGGGPVTHEVDLTTAQTVDDLRTRLEAPFAGDLSVSITSNGLQLTPAAGTVAVADLPNSHTATRLGIRNAAAASITSADFNPRITAQTTLASLNGGTGIGATAGNGLLITNGTRSATIDLDGLTTVQDLFNAIHSADIDVMTGFTDDGSGLRISSRLSGVDFSIAENNGNNAARLGILTFSATTPLAALNLGQGVPVGGAVDLEISRRNGETAVISLAGANTIQDVLNLINAEDPGILVASLSTSGNGLVIGDNSGTGALTITENSVTRALGIAGSEDGNADLLGTNIGIVSSSSLLANLNQGAGAPVGPDTLDITRRDGTVVNISLAGAVTVQDVLEAVNAVDPGNLTLEFSASLGAFRLNDNAGTGPLIVAENDVANGLGLTGSEDGVVDLVGRDPNPQRAGGVLDLLFRLGAALRAGDNQELEAIDKRVNAELESFNFQRGAVAARLKSLDTQASAIESQQLQTLESLSNVFDTDMALAITQFTNLQVSIQATQQIAARTLQLNLFNYI